MVLQVIQFVMDPTHKVFDMKKKKKIIILDTTLRDGQQSPDAGMSFDDNIKYAEHAHALGINVLEAGFAAASSQDFKIVNTISALMASKKSQMKISSLCQLQENQVYQTMRALHPSLPLSKARVHVYLPVDPDLIYASLGIRSNEYNKIIMRLYRLVNEAVKSGFEVEFSAEGYSCIRSDSDFTMDLFRAAIDAGARIINCPDTIGAASRWEGEHYFVNTMNKHAEIIAREYPDQDVTWSVHCHNDFGLALSNTLAAVFDGPASQIEGCFNGVGERAGNVALEQCIMAILQFGDQAHPDYSFHTNIFCELLCDISDFVSEHMLPRQPHWPITGKNIARHSSGGHTNAMLNNPRAYQPFDPKRVGQAISFVFGPLSGSNHLKAVLQRNGIKFSGQDMEQVAQTIKGKLPKNRKSITDDELISLYLSAVKVSS